MDGTLIPVLLCQSDPYKLCCVSVCIELALAKGQSQSELTYPGQSYSIPITLILVILPFRSFFATRTKEGRGNEGRTQRTPIIVPADKALTSYRRICFQHLLIISNNLALICTTSGGKTTAITRAAISSVDLITFPDTAAEELQLFLILPWNHCGKDRYPTEGNLENLLESFFNEHATSAFDFAHRILLEALSLIWKCNDGEDRDRDIFLFSQENSVEVTESWLVQEKESYGEQGIMEY
ncbi:hypothetical protein NE237_000241 [Protea cynaroides]|uniref:Uncharacterized protein n=1 Tax=Protea cynaroides TaxID=273540 RepID=A0A9Q0QXA7_9MAGN|nr:hypothetical protein NE237_000241 [Protea cynaroides]